MKVAYEKDNDTVKAGQFRQQLGLRGRQMALAAGMILGLTACLEVDDNPSQQGPNGPLIQLVHGQNCWSNLCFFYDANRSRVAVRGREYVRLPASIDVSDGFVTEAEFSRMSSLARMAPTPDRGI